MDWRQFARSDFALASRILARSDPRHRQRIRRQSHYRSTTLHHFVPLPSASTFVDADDRSIKTKIVERVGTTGRDDAPYRTFDHVGEA